MLNRGFGNSLFNMVPKVFEKRSSDPKCFRFENSLFNIVPKDLRF